MREARHEDIDYFIRSGKAFCESTPFSFDAESYAEAVHNIIDDPDCISAVIPGKAHCVAKLVPNFYNDSEIIAKVFTTWGKGGLLCFTEVEKQARNQGATFLMADSFIDSRVIRFYERHNMTLADSVFIKEL